MKISVIAERKKSFLVSWILLLISFISFFAFKINYGVDMTWGVQIEYSYEAHGSPEDLKEKADKIEEQVEILGVDIINSISTYKISGENKVVLVAGFNENVSEQDMQSYKNNFRDSLTESVKDNYKEEKYNFIGKSFWDYIKESAKMTLVIAVIAIALYVSFAFTGYVAGISAFSFWAITILTLVHDVVISAWLYVMLSNFVSEFKVDTYFVTALLTTLGYSINDTIVVLDRIRANLKEFGGKTEHTLRDIVDLSVNETLTRSIYTSLTVVLVLVSILFFGPDTIKGFVLVMIFWTFVWTFSSVFIASPLLYEMNKWLVLKSEEQITQEKEELV